MSNPLPEPWDYAYEWDGPYGCRKLSVASWNGRGPDRSVPIFIADQMHAYADAEVAAARDCHTCKHYAVCLSPHHQGKDCTNADKYEPLPPVQLWRTTP